MSHTEKCKGNSYYNFHGEFIPCNCLVCNKAREIMSHTETTEAVESWWLSKFVKGLPTIVTPSSTGEPALHPDFIEALNAFAATIRKETFEEAYQARTEEISEDLHRYKHESGNSSIDIDHLIATLKDTKLTNSDVSERLEEEAN